MNGLRRMKASGWPGIAVLAIGIFVMVTVEELPIGVLTLISQDIGASEGAVGLGVTVAGGVAGIFGLFTSILIGRLDRRLALTLALLVVAAATFATGASSSIVVYLIARLCAGFGIGVFWALIAVVARKIVAPEKAALATTLAFSGAAVGTILGVPVGTWLATSIDWHMAFYIVAAACLLTAVLLMLLVPQVHANERFTLADYRTTWSITSVRLALIVTAVMVVSQFIAYTYASPALQQFAGVSEAGVGFMLLLMGLAGLVGNLASAPIMRTRPVLALLLVTAGMAVGVTALILSDSVVIAAGAMIIWGLFGGAMTVVLQHWVLTSAGEYAEPAAALDSGIFNAGIAGGAGLGALVLDFSNVTAVFVVAATGMVLSTLGVLVCRKQGSLR